VLRQIPGKPTFSKAPIEAAFYRTDGLTK